MTENEIRVKLTSLGFYKNNNSTLSKEENTENTENSNLNEELQTLSKLFKEGLLTEEEFKAAKKKLLNN